MKSFLQKNNIDAIIIQSVDELALRLSGKKQAERAH